MKLRSCNIGTFGKSTIVLYCVALLLMPYFHIHPEHDHHETKGSHNHSHLTPFHSDSGAQTDPSGTHEHTPTIDTFKILHILSNNAFSQIRLFDIPVNHFFIPHVLNLNHYPELTAFKTWTSAYHIAIARPQVDNYVHFFANISPPIA